MHAGTWRNLIWIILSTHHVCWVNKSKRKSFAIYLFFDIDILQNGLFSSFIKILIQMNYRVSVSAMKEDFNKCLVSPVGFKGFAIPEDKLAATVPFMFDGQVGCACRL